MAAAFASGGILFDSLIDSIVVSDHKSSRVVWYNRVASSANTIWMAGAVICWIADSAALAEHYGIGHTMQLSLLAIVAAPVGLAIVIALVHSLLRLLDRRTVRWQAPTIKRARRNRP